MARDEEETRQTNGYDEIDDEIDFDDAIEDRSHKFKYLKKILYALLLIVMGLFVVWMSFKGCQKILTANKTTIDDSLQKNVTNDKEMQNVAIDPKTGGLVEGKGKSGSTESVSVTIVEPSSEQIEKKNNPVMEKSVVQPTKADLTPVPKADRSAANTIPEISVPDVKPEANAVTVKPETKVSKPVAKKKTTARKTASKRKVYKVIVGSFSIKANAVSLTSRLTVNNFKPKIVRAKTPKGQLYRVVAGSYRSLRETKAKIGELEKLGFKSFYLVE